MYSFFKRNNKSTFLNFLNQFLNFITMCSQNSVGLYTALGFQSVTCYTCETLRTKERDVPVPGWASALPPFLSFIPPAFKPLP